MKVAVDWGFVKTIYFYLPYEIQNYFRDLGIITTARFPAL